MTQDTNNHISHTTKASMTDTLLVLIAMFFWGANWSAAKVVSALASPTYLVLFRFSLVSLFFIPVLWIQKIPFRISRKDSLIVLFSSLFMGVYQYLFFLGLRHGLAGSGGIVVTTLNPILTWLIVSIITQKRPKGFEIIGLCVGLFSAFFFLRLWEFDVQALFVSGTFHFLLASFFWAIVTVLREYASMSSLLYTFYTYLPIAILLGISLPINTIIAESHQPLIFWLNLIFIASFGTIVSTSAFFYITQKTGAKSSSSYIFTVPVFAVVVATIVLKEPLPLSMIMGGICAMSSVYILNKKKKS